MKKMLPIITTLVRAEHNPGDTFIGLGGQYLIERILGPVNWLILNKFSHMTYWDKYKDLIQEAGIIFYAGMPQYNNYDDWCLWYDKEMWEKVIIPRNLKVISIAGGAGYPNAEWTPQKFANHCMESQKTKNLLQARKSQLLLTTVRDAYAHELLNKIGIENHFMPCSATFAMKFAQLKAEKDRDLVILVPPSFNTVPNQYFKNINNKEEETRNRWLAIYQSLKKEYKKILVVCHFYSEYYMLKNFLSSEDLFFTTDYLSLLKIYTKANLVISARLHGALPAYGLPGTKVVCIALDTRGHSVSIFPKIPLIIYQNLSIDNIIKATREAVPSEESDFTPWLEKYDSLISNIESIKKFS